jgi:hypothetical protein
VEGRTEGLVKVADVLGCEGSDAGLTVPEGHHFGTREEFEIGKEGTMEREVVKKRVGL